MSKFDKMFAAARAEAEANGTVVTNTVNGNGVVVSNSNLGPGTVITAVSGDGENVVIVNGRVVSGS